MSSLDSHKETLEDALEKSCGRRRSIRHRTVLEKAEPSMRPVPTASTMRKVSAPPPWKMRCRARLRSTVSRAPALMPRKLLRTRFSKEFGCRVFLNAQTV